jgi:PAS domain-containing protein
MTHDPRIPEDIAHELQALRQRVAELEQQQSERRQIEERLRASEERFRVLTENITATILIHGGGHVLYSNPACEALLGYTTEELRDIGFAGFIHPDSLATVQQRGAGCHGLAMHGHS